MVIVGLALALIVSTPCTPASHPGIAEVLYDAVGDDTGREFVELFNPTDRALPLAGVRLEAGDGSGPARWTLRWTGGAPDSIRARARFVIGGALVTPAPDAIASLDLQNGPDAMRLVWPDGTSEMLGWGVHEFSGYACGEPAPDVASGQSLARVPDDSGVGSNALDFRPATPSPGRANRAARNAALVTGSLSLLPEQPAPQAPVEIRGRVANAGAAPLAAGELRVIVSVAEGSAERPLAEDALSAALAAGDSAGFALGALAPPPGAWWLRARVALAGDESPADDADSLRIRAGDGPLRLTEVQFHPAAGEGEWVEVRNTGDVPLDLAGFTLGDRTATRATIGDGSAELAPESLAVIAQDRAALLLARPSLDSTRVWRAAPWPSLNNTDDALGTADDVALRERDGTPCDLVRYSAKGIPAGVPIEWRDGGWWPALLAGGTPLAPPREPAALTRRFELSARRLRAGDPPPTATWSLPWPAARLRLELYDLGGRRVRRAWPEFTAPAHGERPLELTGIAPGLYALALIAHDTRSADQVREVRALRIEAPR